MARVEIAHAEVDPVAVLTSYVHSSPFRNPAPVQETYRSCFNWVDKADRHWYSIQDHHHYQRWTARYLVGLLRFQTINMHTWANQHYYQSFHGWRKEFSRKIVRYDP
jgi:hypothetical protein